MGEFGRAPRVAVEKTFAGDAPGRKHWAAVYSIVLAGAGVARGGVFGASDRIGGYPASHPVGPWDVAATMFAALGVDPAGACHRRRRPHLSRHHRRTHRWHLGWMTTIH